MRMYEAIRISDAYNHKPTHIVRVIRILCVDYAMSELYAEYA
jgi:hypothetical protein